MITQSELRQKDKPNAAGPSASAAMGGTRGLRHPSTARLSSLLSVEKKLIKRELGRLHPEDLARMAQGLREAFGL
jgi:hypothetical protein